ncbi:MAG: FAD-binding protein, partial [Pricia sp.]|nr:FAD-binding protein [Pricia sp.]
MAACKQEKKIQVEKLQAERTNWAGNYTYKAKNLYEPKTVEEVQALVKKLDTQKALGSC